MMIKEPTPPVHTLSWLLIGFMWISYFLNYCDRQVVYSIFPILHTNLGFTNVQLGLTGSLFIWATGVTSPFVGKLSEIYSAQRLVVSALILWSVVTFLTGLSNSPAALLTGRTFLGISEAVFVPVAVSLIGNTLPLAFRSRAIGLFFSAPLLGVVAGGSLGGWVADHLGWRLAFFYLGAAGALLAIPLAVFLRRFQDIAPMPDQPSRSGSHFRELSTVPSFVALCCCFPAFLVVLTIMYSWLPDFLHDRFSLSLASAGFKATAYLQTGTALGLLAGSCVSDRWYRSESAARFQLLVIAMIFGAPWVYLVSHASLPVAELGTVGFGIANGIFTSNIMVAPFDVVPLRTRITAIAVLNTIAPPFTGMATVLTGVWKERFGIANIMTMLAVLMVIAGVVLLLCTAQLFKADHEKLLAEIDLTRASLSSDKPHSSPRCPV